MAEKKSTYAEDGVMDPDWWETQYEHGKGFAGQVGDFFDPDSGGLAKMLGVEEKKFGVQPKSAEYYQDRNVGRMQVLEDIKELQRLQRTGGAATREAKELQRVAAKGQRGLHRGLGMGGRGERMGTEAAGESYVQAMGPVAMIKEAESAGYSKQEAAAAALLVMDDKKFQDSLDKIGGDIARGEAQATQAGRAGFMQKAGAIGGAILAFSDERAKTNIRPISKAAPRDFLEKLNTGGFDYRPEFGGERGRMGPLLNEEVAKTEVGRSFIKRDPQTGYLVTDPNAAALTTMALLKEQNERIEALEAGKKGKKKAPQERPLLLDRLQPPPSLDRANVVYAEDVKDQYPGWVDMERQYRDFSSGKHTETLGRGRRMREWREQAMPRGMPSSGAMRPYFLGGHPSEILVNRRFVPLEARIAKLEKMKKKKSGKGRK